MNFTSLVIGLLTIALVINSLLLILLVLVQLPKKEAGLGMAFGGAAADALFGAGSGTVVSRWTKYGTGLFLILSLVLSVLRNHEARAAGRNIASELERRPAATTSVVPPATDPAAAPALPILQLTNPPAAPATNPAPTGSAPVPNPGQ
jgi:preprotein translocase subunit SecG